MISFECDYNNGACQQVIDNLVRFNDAKPTPYGFDEFSERAKALIRKVCGLPDAQIFFLTGGTQTNATTIDSMLYQYEGVICVGSGHINVHEAGAVEFTEQRSSHCQTLMANWRQKYSTNISTIICTTATRTMPYTQDSSISPFPPSSARSTVPRN